MLLDQKKASSMQHTWHTLVGACKATGSIVVSGKKDVDSMLNTIDANALAPRQNQASMDNFWQKQMDPATKKRLNKAIANWVATACRPIRIVEDEGLVDTVHIVSNDWTYEFQSRATIATCIQDISAQNKDQWCLKTAQNGED